MLPTAEQLADAFIAECRLLLTPEQLATNCPEDHLPDSNVTMCEVFERFGVEFDVQNDGHRDIWNEAWEIAKAKGFAE